MNITTATSHIISNIQKRFNLKMIVESKTPITDEKIKEQQLKQLTKSVIKRYKQGD